MAEFAQRSIEEMLVELDKMRKLALFSTEETRFEPEHSSFLHVLSFSLTNFRFNFNSKKSNHEKEKTL